jgi:two-component system, NarL family, response regulator
MSPLPKKNGPVATDDGAAGTPPLRVLLADDHEVVREGLAAILNRRSTEFQVVAEADDGEQALALWLEHKPDLGVLDLRMPKLDGVATIEAIRAVDAQAKLIILTTYDTDEDIYRGLRAGAKGYLLKDADRDDILHAVRAVGRGETYLPSLVAGKLAQRLRDESLTERELQVLLCIADGQSNKQIARKLAVSEGTVKFYTSGVYSKLGVASRTEAIKVAAARGLIKLGPG